MTAVISIPVWGEALEPDPIVEKLPCTGVVSLLDMLQANAFAFAKFCSHIGELHFKVGETLHYRPEASNKVATPDILQELREFLAESVTACKDLDCEHTGHHAEFYQDFKEREVTYSSVQTIIDALMVSFFNEVGRKVFFQLAGEDAQMFSEKPKALFGLEVAKAFPSSRVDVQEAGNCRALSRWPASVFHCMRVLELGLGVLSGKFGVSADRKNWHNVIEETEAKIRKIDSSWGADWKKQQQFYSDAARHFLFLKDAWRNHVMHVRDEYDQGRALSIWQHTKELMQQLASGGLTETP